MRGRPSAAALAKAGDLDTRTRILDAAERLIAERGIHGVSLREITAAARANSAAIHYYFRRKEDLLSAVVDRRAGIVVQERLNRIDALLAKPQMPTIEELIVAYVTPGLTACFGADELRKHFGRLRARFTHETDPAMRAIMRKHFREPGRKFIEVASRILPSLSGRDLQWRFHMLVATLIYLMAHPGRVQAVDAETADAYNPDNMHEALHYVVPMLVAIFQIPPAARRAAPFGVLSMMSDSNENGDR